MKKYPDAEQIENKKESLVRTLRQFHLGLCDAIMVKNELQCLFTDVGLDMNNKHGKFCENGNFDHMIKDW